jgi:hypothetical protein
VALNLFYQEPEDDRWLPFDRHPRRVARRLIRGPRRPGGQERVFLNLCAGLDRLGIAYRVNDYRHASDHPEELACIIGKPWVLDRIAWVNPILFGPSIYSHPLADPGLLERRRPIRKVLVPGEWMRRMCEPYWADKVIAWPVGIDTAQWCPAEAAAKDVDVLLYDKVRWQRDCYEPRLVEPIRQALHAAGRSFREIRYGAYREDEFHAALMRCRVMIFLCEHETQGIAYQQALASGVPLFAWDRQGHWRDPEFYPDRVMFEPVTSVPYWDAGCGMRFADIDGFRRDWLEFWALAQAEKFTPRKYILENLTLESCAGRYVEIAKSLCC